MKGKRLAAALLAVIAIAAAVFYFLVDPTEAALVPKCLFRQLTGLNCPGCGMQRFLHAFVHGRLLEAFSYNYLLVLLLPYTLLFGLERLVLTGRAQLRLRNMLEGRMATIFFCIVAPAWTVVRNILNI